jgi:hypothetical protein
MRTHRVFFALATVVLASSHLRADSWATPTPRLFASQWGSRGFKVVKPTFRGPSEGELFRLDADGKEQAVWEAKLVNTPHRVLVDDSGKFVATIDTYANLGFAHSLVIYGDKGKVIRDFKLEDLLTQDEIRKNVDHTETSRWWAKKCEFQMESEHLVLRLAWGKVLRIHLPTGKIAEMK